MNFETLTACGETCENCPKKKAGSCKGCLEADGYVPEWADSGRCPVHACARAHGAAFCGICGEFPCGDIEKLIHWQPGIIEKMIRLREEYQAWT